MSSLGKTERPGEAARAGTIFSRARIRLARRTIFLLTSVKRTVRRCEARYRHRGKTSNVQYRQGSSFGFGIVVIGCDGGVVAGWVGVGLKRVATAQHAPCSTAEPAELAAAAAAAAACAGGARRHGLVLWREAAGAARPQARAARARA